MPCYAENKESGTTERQNNIRLSYSASSKASIEQSNKIDNLRRFSARG